MRGPTSSSARRCRRFSAVRPAAGRPASPRLSLKCAASNSSLSRFEVDGDLAFWRAEIPGRVVGRAEALTGPTTPPGKRVHADQSTGFGGRPWPGRHLGPVCGNSGERLRLRSDGPKLVEQAHPVRLERARFRVAAEALLPEPTPRAIARLSWLRPGGPLGRMRLGLLVSLIVLTARRVVADDPSRRQHGACRWASRSAAAWPPTEWTRHGHGRHGGRPGGQSAVRSSSLRCGLS